MAINRLQLVDPKCGLADRDYDAIESALMETARGRWFLSEYIRRNRKVDYNLLVSATCTVVEALAAVADEIGNSPTRPLPSETLRYAANIYCRTKLDDPVLRGPWPSSQHDWEEEFVSRY